MSKSFYDYCLETGNTGLLAQWAAEKNGDLTPKTVSPSSNKKVWWICDKGHEWQAQISSRSKGSGCPVCANKKIIVGLNDLAATHPEIARQWNYVKNDSLTPQEIFAGNKNKVWWICDKGHEYSATANDRTCGNTGCPYCAGKKVPAGFNDLATKYPEIAAQWHPDKNGDLSPEKLVAHSNKKVWWICAKGHDYLTAVSDRTSRSYGCPICDGKKVLAGFNDLATIFPEIAAEWYQELNGDLTPEMVTPGSNKKVWWQCSLGHIWHAHIYSRTRKRRHGCPVCAGVVSSKRTTRYRVLEMEDKQTK